MRERHMSLLWHTHTNINFITHVQLQFVNFLVIIKYIPHTPGYIRLYRLCIKLIWSNYSNVCDIRTLSCVLVRTCTENIRICRNALLLCHVAGTHIHTHTHNVTCTESNQYSFWFKGYIFIKKQCICSIRRRSIVTLWYIPESSVLWHPIIIHNTINYITW